MKRSSPGDGGEINARDKITFQRNQTSDRRRHGLSSVRALYLFTSSTGEASLQKFVYRKHGRTEVRIVILRHGDSTRCIRLHAFQRH